VRGCSLGLAFSCSSAARAYAEGKGVSKDVQKGLDYFAKACQGGSSEVCGDFADELVKGEAFPKDLRRASEIATKLCESPDAKAQARAFSYCDKAAEIYLELGRPDKALPFAKKACESSKPMGCFTLAQMQESGKGTPKNAAAANAIYQEGCDEILYKIADDLRYHPACPAYFETKQDSAPAAKPKSKPKGKGGPRRRT
jgi:uncharacterized protein